MSPLMAVLLGTLGLGAAVLVYRAMWRGPHVHDFRPDWITPSDLRCRCGLSLEEHESEVHTAEASHPEQVRPIGDPVADEAFGDIAEAALDDGLFEVCERLGWLE